MERLWGGGGDEEEGGMAHPALLTTGADGVLRLWVEVQTVIVLSVVSENFIELFEVSKSCTHPSAPMPI